MTEGEELSDAVERAYQFERQKNEVSPISLANRAMQIIGFERTQQNRLAYAGCHANFQQIARAKLRGRHDPLAKIDDQMNAGDDLFPETLQERYPKRPRKDEDATYVLRQSLSESDRWYNIDRLGKASEALAKHRRALTAETVALYGERGPKAA